MCALKAHIKPSNFGNIFSRIEKIINTFLILEKIFSNIGDLMYAFRAYINRTLIIINFSYCYPHISLQPTFYLLDSQKKLFIFSYQPSLGVRTKDMQESSLYLSCFSRDATGTSGEVLGDNNDVSGSKARGGDI